MIDITKTYRTRCGYPVQLYRTDAKGDCPVQGSIDIGPYESIGQWGFDGTHPTIEQYDLIEVKPRIQREVWVNVYENTTCGSYATKELADINSSRERIACVHLTIDCEHGEGLE
jgi:hypothetical protein